jgi:glycosyltransferase involved in cell wall biosynthesis
MGGGTMENPQVTIITPSYNMAAYIEETIQSVLSQDYSPLEYLIMDGGSDDGTIDILEKYRGRIQYVSQPDGGAADAIARGFAQGRGSILGWLSADDTYLPGALATAVEELRGNPNLAAVYGQAWWTGARGQKLAPYPTEPFDPARLAQRCYICQPACWFRREAYARAGGLDVSLRSAFDYDLWIRMAKTGPFAAVGGYLATSRMHPSNKTLGQRRLMFQEGMRILKRQYGYVPPSWAIGYASYLVNRKDQFFQPVKPSALECLLGLGTGTWHNRARCLRFWKDWGLEVCRGVKRRYGQ